MPNFIEHKNVFYNLDFLLKVEPVFTSDSPKTVHRLEVSFLPSSGSENTALSATRFIVFPGEENYEFIVDYLNGNKVN